MSNLLTRLKTAITQRVKGKSAATASPTTPAPITQEIPLPQQYVEAQPISPTVPLATVRHVEVPIPAPATPTQVPPKPERREPKGIFKFFSNLNLFFRGMIAMAGLIGIILGVMAISMITSIDTVVMKLSLEGTVTDSSGVPISQASVTVGEQTTATDTAGIFVVGGLNIARYQVTIAAPGFTTLSQEVAVSRTLLNYTTKRTFVLQPNATATVKGQVTVGDNKTYNFADDRIVMGGKQYVLGQDGGFTINDAMVGTAVSFQFKAEKYTDIVRDIEIKPGENDLGALPVTPAGDIVVSLKSYLREDVVNDLQVAVEGVPPAQVATEEDMLRVRDLEVAKSYKMRISHAQYISRDYTIGVKQGRNDVFNFRIVEQGLLPFVRTVSRQQQVFTAQFDGADVRQRTESQNNEPDQLFVKDNFVYFASKTDRLRNPLGGFTSLIYRIPAGSGAAERVTTSYANFGTIVANYVAGKLVNISEGTTNDTQIVEVADLTGENRKAVFTSAVDGEVTRARLSDSGTAVAFEVAKNGAKNGIHHTDLTTSKSTQIVRRPNSTLFAISTSGDRILYSSRNDSSGLNDLYVYTVSTGQDTRLRNGITGTQYQFIHGSNTEVIFADTRGGVLQMLTLDTEKNTEKQLTDFKAGVEKLDRITQQAGVVVYSSDRALYVMDSQKQIVGKKVTTDFKL